ncbi:MAG: hypothetical protein ACRCSF_12210 [Mycobacteriaceae bacterium]
MDGILRWWDAAELWITGLPFIPQVALVMLVVVPIAAGIAKGSDLALAVFLDQLSSRKNSKTGQDQPPSSVQSEV